MSTKKLDTALFAIQGEIQGIVKEAENPHFKSDYADRTSILEALKPLLQKHNILLLQGLVPSPSAEPSLAMTTELIHVDSGESRSFTAVVPLQKPDPQGYGSAMTYTSRYSLVAILALPLLDDDDGNAASNLPAPRQQTMPRKPLAAPKESVETLPPKGTTKLWGNKKGATDAVESA